MSSPDLTSAELDAVRPITSLWWLFVLMGVATFGVGLFLVFSPNETLTTFAVIAGIFLVVDGILALLASIFGKGEGRSLLAIIGVISLIAGVVLIKHPFSTLVVFTLIVGLWFLVAGIVRLASVFLSKQDRGTNLLIGVVDGIAGLIILAWPNLGLATVAVIIGVVLIIRGVLFVVAGLGLRTVNKDLPATT